MVLTLYRQPHVLTGIKSESMKEVPVSGGLELLTHQENTRRGNWDRAGMQDEDHSRLKKRQLSGLQGRWCYQSSGLEITLVE